jgi:hypothetical protein
VNAPVSRWDTTRGEIRDLLRDLLGSSAHVTTRRYYDPPADLWTFEVHASRVLRSGGLSTIAARWTLDRWVSIVTVATPPRTAEVLDLARTATETWRASCRSM